MGFAEDSMHSYIERDLKKRFNTKEGWKIDRNPSFESIFFDYQVIKKRFGESKRYLVDVLIAPKISSEKAAELAKKMDAVKDKVSDLQKYILVVPNELDISVVPDGIEVMELKVLKVDKGDVVWWRKPVE
jgi:hypothetical protein